ncbi:MAG: shikimate kinase [Pyrinomonadaceae bacterium]
MINQKIVIIGFMGTGKSTVARQLGGKLNCLAIDLDELIARRESRRPGEIIEQDGENEFRKLETQLLREVLVEQSAGIIAVGGGAWTIAANRRLIARRGAFTVWLDAPFELCWKRIEAGGQLRPLARSREMAEQLYLKRRPVYELADLMISISEKQTATEIATKVSNLILALRQKS